MRERLDWQNIEGEYFGLKAIPKINYQDSLEKVSKSMIRFKKPEHLIKMIVRMIDGQVGVRHAAVLLYSEDRHAFVLIDSKGRGSVETLDSRTGLSIGSPLITAFTQKEMAALLDESGALSYQAVENMLKDEIPGGNAYLIGKLKSIMEEMDILHARICIPSYFKKTLMGVLILGDKISGEEFTRGEIGFFLMLANNAAMAIANAQLIGHLQEKVKEVEMLYRKTNSLFIRTSIALVTAIDARDPYTHGHTVRVTGYCLAAADELLNLQDARAIENFKESLHIAALLHDIGKIGIPDDILLKKEKLTAQELDRIKEHPAIGASILYPVKELSSVVGGVRSHQERFDGSGYPDRLRGKDIPLLARIIAVADAFDAITTNRPYRPKRTHEDAILELERCTGTQFDPQITDVFIRTYEKNRLLNYI